MKAKLKALTQKKVFSLICLLVAMCIIFTVWAAIRDSRSAGVSFFKALGSSNFLNMRVGRNILNSMVITSFLTIGAGALLIGGYLDLSMAAIGCFGGMVLAVSVRAWGMSWWLAIILALVLCAILGFINGLMVTKLHFPSFIATLGMASMAKGLMMLVSSFGNGNGLASNVVFADDTLNFLGKGMVGPAKFQVQLAIILMFVFFIVYGILISKTSFGAKITLLGGGPVAATLAGIKADKLINILFINGAVLSGIAGIFSSVRMMQGSVNALASNQFTGLTAAILGGISFGGGVGGMGGAFVGLLILSTFSIGMQIVNVNPHMINVFSGLLLLIALAMDFFAMARKQKALH